MTEDEAKTKWCPFSRTGLHAGAGGVSVNRSVGDGTDGPFDVIKVTRCFASACMAWRETHVRRTWLVQANGKHSAWEEWQWDPATKPGYEHLPSKPGIVEPHGHCGLAGKP